MITLSTIAYDRNGWVKPRATVEATWRAWNGPATPQELLFAINSQVKPSRQLTLVQVKRSMRDLGRPRTPGSNHWVKDRHWQPR